MVVCRADVSGHVPPGGGLVIILSPPLCTEYTGACSALRGCPVLCPLAAPSVARVKRLPACRH